jgi:hypothetical protein
MNSYTSDLFGYSVTFNPATFSNVGFLSNLSIPTTSTLQGSILSETGKKLYPGASDGVSTLMVSVYDQTSKVTGFINPNSPTFAIFTTDKPPYMGQGTDPGSDGRTNLGNSIYTHGSVIADGFGTYAGLLSTGTSLTVGTIARVGQFISSPSTLTSHVFVTPAGTTPAAGGASIGRGALVSGILGISTTAVQVSSIIFLTANAQGSGSTIRVSSISAGVNFSVIGTGSDTFNWLIIN